MSLLSVNILKNLNKTSFISIRCLSTTNKALNKTFTKEDLESYDKNGFFLVKNLVSHEKLEKFKARFQKICSEKIKIPGMTVMKDVAIAKSEFLQGERAITKVQDFWYLNFE